MASVYEELKKQYMKSNKLYEDPKFLTNSTFLFKGGPRFGVKWLRPKELVKNPQFIADGFAYNDFDQGGLGNCWFIASVACLSASDHKEILKRIVPADQNFDKDYFGAFRFNFWQYGKWVEIVVDDRLPTYNGKLIYGCNKKYPNEFWCSLLEKAFAKLHGNYDVIDGGRIHSSLVDLTGGIGEMVPLRQEIADRDLRNILINCSKMNSIMGAAIFNQLAVPGERELKRDTGLYEGHAYAIINIKEVNIKHSTVTLLHLRNPWGHGEWNGPFSDKSPEWNLLSQADKDATLKTKDDGEFWISLTDFRTNFDELEICHLTPDALTEEISHNLDRSQWAVTEHYGSWVSGVSAGGPPLSFTSRKFWTNPQFELSLSHANKPTTVIISLFEVDDLLKRAAEDISIGFVILKHNRVRSKPSRITAENFSEYAPRLVETSGKYWPYRERTKRYLLEPGEHIIIPCTFKAGLEAEFYLRVFAETPIDSQPVNVPKNNADIVPSSPKDTSEYAIMKAFDGIVGRDGFIDAADLVIVFQAGLEAAGEGKGLNIETCRCITGLSDIQSSKGLIDKEGVRKVWSDLQNWRKAFRLIDTDKNNAVDANELQKLFETIDFNAGPEAVAAIMKRYGGKNGKISEEDFLQCFCKTMHLFRTYKELSTGGKITMSLNQWISVGLRT